MANKVRIIGGEWRSRQIGFTDAPGLRPTPDRVRETLFNWLQTDVPGSRCLDLYAGSGALGFEAASRGAAWVALVETNPEICRKLRENTALLAAKKIEVVQDDAGRFLKKSPPEKFDLVFLDPPFGQNLVAPGCQLLENQGWLTDYAKIYIEAERQLELTDLDLPDNWRLLKHKVAGQVSYGLYQRHKTQFRR